LCLPPSSRRVVSATAANGERLTVFEGTGPLSTWKRSLQRCLRQAGYRPAGSSPLVSGGWSARYESSAPEVFHMIEIHISPSASGLLTGIISTHQH
jgi:hypothetical protein